jgi:DNA polymerase eta
VADIFSRCVEEGVLENKRRPKSINLHHRQGAQTRSRQAPIPQGKPLSEAILFDLAKNLLAQVVVDGRAWPCANLSLSVGGFEDGITNNKGIGGFLVRGEEAKAMMSTGRPTSTGEPPTKRRRTKGNIANFFGPKDDKRKDFDAARAVLLKAHSESTRDDTEDDVGDHEDEEDVFEEAHDEAARPSTPPLDRHSPNMEMVEFTTPPSAQPQPRSQSPPQQMPSDASHPRPQPPPVQKTLDTYFCAQCNLHIALHEKAEHVDYHFALDLSKEMRQEERIAPAPAVPPPAAQAGRKTPSGQKPTRGRGRPPGSGGSNRSGGGEKGQAKLAFGRQS